MKGKYRIWSIQIASQNSRVLQSSPSVCFQEPSLHNMAALQALYFDRYTKLLAPASNSEPQNRPRYAGCCSTPLWCLIVVARDSRGAVIADGSLPALRIWTLCAMSVLPWESLPKAPGGRHGLESQQHFNQSLVHDFDISLAMHTKAVDALT